MEKKKYETSKSDTQETIYPCKNSPFGIAIKGNPEEAISSLTNKGYSIDDMIIANDYKVDEYLNEKSDVKDEGVKVIILNESSPISIHTRDVEGKITELQKSGINVSEYRIRDNKLISESSINIQQERDETVVEATATGIQSDEELRNIRRIKPEFNNLSGEKFGKYIINEKNEICRSDEAGNIIPLCNFVVIALRDHNLDDGCRTERKHYLSIVIENGRSQYNIELTDEELITDKWISIKSYSRARLNPDERNAYRHIKSFISIQLNEVEVINKIGMLGWIKQGEKKVFVCSNFTTGDPKVLSQMEQKYNLIVNKSLQAQEAMCDMMNMGKIVKDGKGELLLVYLHIAVLRTLFVDAGEVPTFSPYLHGRTGSGKTTLAKLFFQIYNRNILQVNASFFDTVASMEYTGFLMKDAVCIVDDYCPSPSKAHKKEMESKGQQKLRRDGDNKGMGRLSRDLKPQRRFDPRSLTVYTGEELMSVESSSARLVEISINAGDVNFDLLTYYQKNKYNISTYLSFFLQWVTEHYSQIVEQIREYIIEGRNQRKTEGVHLRNTEMEVFVMAMLHIIEEYYMSIFASKSNDIINFGMNVTNCLETIRISKESRAEDLDPVSMCLTAIKEGIESNLLHVVDASTYAGKITENTILQHENYYYIKNHSMNMFVIRFWKKLGIDFTTSKNKLNEFLDDAKVIKTEKTDRKYRTVKLPSGVRRIGSRFTCIYIDRMEEILTKISS